MRKLLLSLHFIFIISLGFSQPTNRTRIQNAPEWVQYMYGESINLITLNELYESYYRTHKFEKNQFTQDYKRLMKDHWIEKDTNGQLQPTVDYPISAQQKAPTSLWQEVGPWDYDHEQAMEFEVQSPGAAHVYTVEQSPINADLIVCGTATAGVWKSIDKGLNWQLITRDLDVNGVYSIALDPSNVDIIYFGEEDGQIWKSIDGGANWSPTGDATFQLQNNFVRDLKFIGPNTLLAATDAGLLRTTDGGLNWTIVQAGEHMEIEIKPDDPTILFTVKETGNQTEFYKSIDNGLTWVLKPIGWPDPAVGDEQKRCEISVTTADPNLIYILASGSVGPDGGLYGIYKSSDAGETFTFECCDGSPGGTPSVTNPNILGWSSDGTEEGGQFYYDLAMGASPTDVNRIFGAGINVWRSLDAGANWEINGHWVTWVGNLKHRYSHADVHDIKFFDNGTSIDMWVASDGGLFYSSTQGDTLEPRMHGIHGTDFWGFEAGFKEGYVIVGGTYHNGTLIRYKDIYEGGLADPTIGGWLAELGGDNYRGFVNYGDNKIGYADNGAFTFSDVRTERIDGRAFQSDKKCNTSYVTGEYGTYGFHPNNYNTFYSPVGSELYKTTNGGISFLPMHDFGGDKVIQVKVAPSNPQVIYLTHKFASSNFKIWKSADGGSTWEDITPTSAETSNNGNRTKYIEIDDQDENKIWCILMGTQTGNKVFQSIDGGSNWTNLTTPSIQSENVISIAHHYGTEDGLYIGTRKRVYYKNASMPEWVLFNNNLPASIAANFLQPYYGEGKIRTATQRGVFECEFYEDAPPVAGLAADITYLNLASDCSADTVQFVDHSTVRHASATWNWTFSGGSPSSSTLQNPKVVYDTPGNYPVKLVVTDAFGIDSMEILNFITVTNSFGNTTIIENFDGNTFPPTNWKLEDSEGSSWEQDWPEGDDSDRVASYPNYWVDATGQKHYLVTPAVDLTNAVSYNMTFDRTYNDNGSYDDSLAIVYRSSSQPDWQTIWIKGGAGLEVWGTDVWFWYDTDPTIGWVTEWMDLSFLVGESCVEFAFENRGYYGNHIWIDDVNLTGDFLQTNELSAFNLNAFPNPSNGDYTIQTNKLVDSYRVVSLSGSEILKQEIVGSKQFEVNLQDEAKGIYFLYVKSGETEKVIKLIKN